MVLAFLRPVTCACTVLALCGSLAPAKAGAQSPPPTPSPRVTRAGAAARSPAEVLLSRDVLRALDEELSGTLMRDHVAHLAGIHRVPATPGYHEAAEWVMARARAYGLSDVHVESFPGDGKTWFGTMRGNRGWRVEGGDLTEVSPRARRIGSLHVTRSPWSVASVTDDVAETFARYVIDGAYAGAATGDFSAAVREPNGPKDALWADITEYESGSDHWVYQEGSFGIPTIYLRDWPDIYIHTNKDVADNVDPTKIKRSAFIAAASGYYLSVLGPPVTFTDAGLPYLVLGGAMRRLGGDIDRSLVHAFTKGGEAREAAVVAAEATAREMRRLEALDRFGYAPPGSTGASVLDEVKGDLARMFRTGAPPQVAPDLRVPTRNAAIKGPLAPSVDWVAEKAGASAAALAINKVPRGDDVAYEIVNFIDGKRTVGAIRDAVSAEFGPVDLAAVAEYLDLLAKIGAVTLERR